MTRINASIPPQNLCDQMLIAEHREIKRIPNTIARGKAVVKDIPTHFKMGTGHVKFFYDKLGYLANRYALLRSECLRRGFEVSDYSNCFEHLPANLMGDWVETPESGEQIRERIRQKLAKMKNIRYLGTTITSNQALKILNK